MAECGVEEEYKQKGLNVGVKVWDHANFLAQCAEN